MSLLGLAFVVISVTSFFTHALPEVESLWGDGHFRSLTLHWTYGGGINDLSGFLVHFCEDQAWGKYKCRNETFDHTEANEIPTSSESPFHKYEITLLGLRMATNYSIQVVPLPQGVVPVDQGVEPVDQDVGDPVAPYRNPQYGRALGREIIVQTKGFSARATTCLANSSVVQVYTGPNFGGMISVEDSTDPGCSTHGDKSSKETSYFLTIDHNLCGSQVLNTSVRTFIMVQENLPILTHSTRRFLVVCNYVPETFTVRAGVSLPDDDGADDAIFTAVDQSVLEVDPSELFDAANNIFDSRLSQDVGRALKMSAEQTDNGPELWFHLAVMVILVAAAVVGTSCAIWYFVQHSRTRHRQGFMTPQEEPRGLEFGNHMEDAVRDYTQGTPSPPPPPPAVLVSVKPARPQAAEFETDA
ncbi:uncharacterized protein LOC143035501 [Oratosquilla oratoria]|uniref:uncharacterized protein LOC143035501 n=1 Tax=Oratosquilla oratoria TaxID=337810 RepID=UPI003F76A116